MAADAVVLCGSEVSILLSNADVVSVGVAAAAALHVPRQTGFLAGLALVDLTAATFGSGGGRSGGQQGRTFHGLLNFFPLAVVELEVAFEDVLLLGLRNVAVGTGLALWLRLSGVVGVRVAVHVCSQRGGRGQREGLISISVESGLETVLCAETLYAGTHQSVIDLMKLLIADSDPSQLYTPLSYVHPEDALFSSVTDPDLAVLCDGCERNITEVGRVAAAESDYCMGCFANMEVFPAQYQVLNPLDFALFDSEWSAEEELALLEAMEKCSLDWEQVAEEMDHVKSAVELQQHYEQVYLGSSNLLPTRVATQRVRINKQPVRETQSEQHQQKTVAQPIALPKPAGGRTVRRRNRRKVRRDRKMKEHVENDVPVFLPKRKEFEEEYDAEAEILLADMEWEEGESQALIDLKFRVMLDYNKRVQNREIVKKFALERRLLDYPYQLQLNRNSSLQQKQVRGMLKVFTRFSPKEEHEALVGGFSKILELESRIAQLKRLKRSGVTTLKEAGLKDEENEQTQDYWEASLGEKRVRNRNTTAAAKKKEYKVVSEQEKTLCKRLKLPEEHFLLVKTTLQRESFRNDELSEEHIMEMFKLPASVVMPIWRYIIRCKRATQDS